jgi:phosphonate transport system substrate-binding protein
VAMGSLRSLAVLVAVAAGVALLAVQATAGSSSTSATRATCPSGSVRFGIEPYEDPAKLTPAYKVLATALQQKLGCPVKLIVVEDYPAEVLAMRNKKLDIAEFGPLGFVFAYQRAHAQAVASFADARGHLTFYRAQIWVAKDSDIKSIQDLKGRSLALSEPGSTSGDAFPRYALRKAGLKESQVKITYAGGHPESLLALVHGKVDAAEINTQQQASATQEKQFDASEFRRIWTSGPIPNDPVTVRGDLPASFKQSVRVALLKLKPKDVAKVGAFLDVDPPGPMVAVTRATYQQLFDLASTLGLTIKDA